MDAPTRYPIDGVLDLHAFRPEESGSVVKEYLHTCLEKGIFEVRIIHGKGIGTLREQVHKALAKRQDVLRFRLDSETGSSWGATLVDLAP